MSYCPGENCKKRDECQLHFNSGQVIDWSRYGHGFGGFDANGNYQSYHETYCGDDGTNGYKYFEPKIITWKDKADWENKHCPAFAEGYACPPGSPILIEDENGEQKVIPFDPETLLLDTKVIDWHWKEKR